MQPLTDNPERRKRVRLTQVCPIRLREATGTGEIAGRMFNRSESGIYFETDTRLDPGSELYIGVGCVPGTGAAADYACLRARIVWCRELADDAHYFYGCGATLYAGGVSSEPAAAGERRRHLRRAFRKPVQLVDENAFYKGVAEDISASGIFVKSGKQPRSGQSVTMGIPDKTGRMVMVRAKVVWSNGAGFGLKFTRTL
jgi:PilZ domain